MPTQVPAEIHAQKYMSLTTFRKTGAGVRITGDRPLWRINFWSIPTTVCPEAYVEVKAEPGKETSWRLTYDFYSLPARRAAAER